MKLYFNSIKFSHSKLISIFIFILFSSFIKTIPLLLSFVSKNSLAISTQFPSFNPFVWQISSKNSTKILFISSSFSSISLNSKVIILLSILPFISLTNTPFSLVILYSLSFLNTDILILLGL